jgi:hypothetical protein
MRANDVIAVMRVEARDIAGEADEDVRTLQQVVQRDVQPIMGAVPTGNCVPSGI